MKESKKKRRAVLVSVEKNGEEFRIRLDDIVNDGTSSNWNVKDHVTNKSVAKSAFESMSFDEKELANFGYYILARLSAFIKRREN